MNSVGKKKFLWIIMALKIIDKCETIWKKKMIREKKKQLVGRMDDWREKCKRKKKKDSQLLKSNMYERYNGCSNIFICFLNNCMAFEKKMWSRQGITTQRMW